MYDSGEVKGGLCRSSADNSWLALDDFFENGKLKEKLPTMADQIRYAKYHASRADHRTFLLKTNHEGRGTPFPNSNIVTSISPHIKIFTIGEMRPEEGIFLGKSKFSHQATNASS